MWSLGTSLVVQWLGLHASTTGSLGLIANWGTKILYVTWHGKKTKQNKKIYTYKIIKCGP